MHRGHLTRRRFIEACASGGALLAPAFRGMAAAQPQAPANLRAYPARAVLTPSDIKYKGVFKLPSPWLFSFSRGALAARRVGGELRFFITGHFEKDLVHEVAYPGVGASTDNAPTAPLVRSWGDVYQGRRLTNEPGPQTWGIKWFEDRLYWTYTTGYEGVSWNQSLGAATLNEGSGAVTSYGPWRASVHSGQFNAHMLDVPSWFQTIHNVGPLAQLGGVHCQNGVAPWGASLLAFRPPPLTVPPDPKGTTDASVQVTKLSYHDISHRQPRVANFKICAWNVIYDCAKGSTLTDAKQEFGGGGQLLDWMDSGVWIDTGTKHGVFMVGQLVDTIPGFAYPNGDTQAHAWYGPAVCCHGHDGRPMHQATGPGASSVVHQGWIYDPADYGRVLRGEVAPWGLLPASTFQLTSLPGFWRSAKRDNLYAFGGMHYDAQTNLLFLAERTAIKEGCCDYPPVIRVFEIG